ncbi:hypothetical protein [Bacillus sp. AFS096315]|uniref:type II restriction enzyme n=1 Tax=Bacillus sp. AFS096315 TaxID=2033517 RepID=UPI000BEDE8C2|nr:hypothetical protein [Bacillus sp. AFS096315]PEC48928.1 hypothetical protein CON00_15260 [Bacillus sp. AFS096315]
MSNESWKKIFNDFSVHKHDFNSAPFGIIADQIKESCQDFKKTNEKEVRILCKQDSREHRPEVFIKDNLFLLPIKNGKYVIVKGEGYLDIPDITSPIITYKSKLDFKPITSTIGNSEMQHVDFAFASGLIQEFVEDESLVLTIRGRKYTPQFSFNVNGHLLEVESVQTEVDAGYEGKEKVVLIEVKNSSTTNTIIRQLFYPYRKWKHHALDKEIVPLFFEKRGAYYYIWQFEFEDDNDYNSIKLVKSKRYKIEK